MSRLRQHIIFGTIIVDTNNLRARLGIFSLLTFKHKVMVFR